jgi:hypothetical protein
MSDASGPRAGKGPRPGKDKAAKGPRPDRPAKAAKPPKPPLRGWDAAGDGFSKTSGYGSPDQAMKGAKRALQSFHKAGRPVEVRLDGSDVTVRVAGPVDDDLKRLVKRIVPKDPAQKAAAQARRAAQGGPKASAGGDEA